jgi:FkbM family methyltransferase
MKQALKKTIRAILIRLQIPLTKNIAYDIATEKILHSILKPDSCCVDVGAHKGEILDVFIARSPVGHHNGFEPIPAMYELLLKKYEGKAVIHPYALAAENGSTTFNIVLDDPAYSGLKQRKYKTANPKIEKIQVQVRTLDEVLAQRNYKISLIKIDVEGGELGVMKGATSILQKDKPTLIFECGRGASEFYGTRPEDVFGFLKGLNYQIFTLKGYLHNRESLQEAEFQTLYNTGTEYYFVAC